MRTIVVFYKPSGLSVCELGDVASPLARGNYRTDSTGRYQIIEIEEFLGVTAAKTGRVISGNEKLLCLLSQRFDEVTAANMLITMEYVGSRPNPRMTQGGLMLTGSAVPDEFDNVVLVTLKLVRQGDASTSSLAALLAAAESLTGRVGDPARTVAALKGGVPPLTIEAGAGETGEQSPKE